VKPSRTLERSGRTAVMVVLTLCLPLGGCEFHHTPCPPQEVIPLRSGTFQGEARCNSHGDYPVCGVSHTLDVDLAQGVAILRYEKEGHLYEETWRIHRADQDVVEPADANAGAADAAAPSESDAAADVGPDP